MISIKEKEEDKSSYNILRLRYVQHNVILCGNVKTMSCWWVATGREILQLTSEINTTLSKTHFLQFKKKLNISKRDLFKHEKQT